MARVPKCRRNIAESLNRLSTAHERYRQTTDDNDRQTGDIAYSERERAFTFAKKLMSTPNFTKYFLRVSCI